MTRRKSVLIGVFVVIAILLAAAPQQAAETKAPQKQLKFYDVRVQTPEFISYYNSIKLTPDQEKIKIEALSSIPAPCCNTYSIATCCCPCNLAKSAWGLSNFAIVKLHYDTAQLKQAVTEWIRFTHAKGFAGNACFQGRCGSSFANDGCGGMQESKIVF